MGQLLSDGACPTNESQPDELLGVFPGVFPGKVLGKLARTTPRKTPRISPGKSAQRSWGRPGRSTNRLRRLFRGGDDESTQPNSGGFAESLSTDKSEVQNRGQAR
jgi:hypothetical protein